MIYLIDDKESRQRDYGWSEDRLSSYSQFVKPIWGIEALRDFQDQIIQKENVILFHESFPQSKDFNVTLDDNSTTLYVVKFSGSKGARFVDERRCMLPPDVLYGNLEIFIKKYQEGELDLRYLAYGENYAFEELLRNRIIEVNKQNTGAARVSCDKKIFFAVTSDNELEVEPPFEITPQKDLDLDFSDRDITDIDLDGLVNKWFLQEKYDIIYIPLCFGSVLSDFIGLRLAMHIRFTPSVNSATPIFIYGEVEFEELKSHYCFDILKTQTVRLISCDNASFISSVSSEMPICELQKEIKLIHLDLPSNIGGHSLANQWGAIVMAKVAGIDYEPTEEILITQQSLYFKYIKTKTRSDDCENSTKRIDAKGKRILLIDDEADKGWADVLRKMLPNAEFKTIQEQVPDYDSLSDGAKKTISSGEYDLIFLDLRMNGVAEENTLGPNEFSGMKILKAIKKQNKGNQVIMLTASNKAWNMKALLDAGVDGYYIKESPEYAFPISYSESNANELLQSIIRCLNNGYLRNIYIKIKKIKELISESSLYGERTEEILSSLDIAYDLLAKSDNRNEYKAYSYLQLFLAIEEYVKHPYVIDSSDTGLYLYNGEKRYRILKDKVTTESGVSYDSKISMVNGHYCIKNGKYTNRFFDTNFLVSAVLIYKFGQDNSAAMGWTKIYKARNEKAAHPKSSNVSINDFDRILNFMLYFFDESQANWRKVCDAFKDIDPNEQIALLVEKFNRK